MRVGDGTPLPEGATVWLAIFDRKHTTKIERGENAGRELSYYNVVRDFRATRPSSDESASRGGKVRDGAQKPGD